MKLSAFPHLTSTEFAAACAALHASYPTTTALTHTPTVLTLRRPLPTSSYTSAPSDTNTDTDTDTDEAIDTDPESLPPPRPQSYITYELHHSPTYNVPILYFQPTTPTPMSLSDIYARLVPTDSAEALRRVGVLGAISQGDHPVTGEVWWFVHPCSTAEAMGELRGLWEEGGAAEMAAEEWYVRVWVGLVGGVVGLRLEEGGGA